MSPWLVVAIVTWIALIVLYLGMVAILHRLRQLDAELRAMRTSGHVKAAGIDLRLPAFADASAPATRLVAAADTGCPACHDTVRALAVLAPDLASPPTLLTYEPVDVWRELAGPVLVRSDAESWRALRPLTPPILLTIDRQGGVTALALPTSPDDVSRVVSAWGLRSGAAQWQ